MRIFVPLLLALWGTYTSALNCSQTQEGNIIFYSQAQLDTRLLDCPSLARNWVVIARNYSGSFVLPNSTTDIWGMFTENDPNPPYLAYAVPNLTSIIADGVTYLNSITVLNAPSIKYISFGNLPQSEDITVQGVGDMALNFPSLNSLHGYLTFVGNFSSINFPALASVYGDITIIGPSGQSADSTEYPSLNITFPVLEGSRGLNISGNISSLYMPKYSAQVLDQAFTSDELFISISTHGNPLNISLPNLSSVSTLELEGTIESFSFPSLLQVSDLSISAAIPLNISLAPLKSLHVFTASGDISGLNMSSVNDLWSVHVNTTLPLDCSSAASALERTGGLLGDWDYSCEGYGNPGTKKKKDIALPLGIGLGLGIPILTLLMVYIVKGKKKRDAAMLDKMPPGYSMHALSEYPPEYPPPAESEDPPEYPPPAEPLVESSSATYFATETHLGGEHSAEAVGQGDERVDRSEAVVDTQRIRTTTME